MYYFYDIVQLNAAGQAGDLGDKHYQCFLGNQKALTITYAMKSSLDGGSCRVWCLFADTVWLSGLIGHLKTHFPPMYRLYLILKSHGTSPTEDKLKMAWDEKILDTDTVAAHSI